MDVDVRHLGDGVEDAPESLPAGRSLITVIGRDDYSHRHQQLRAPGEAARLCGG